MYIVRNILVSTDFSDFSAAAVDYAASFALLSHGCDWERSAL